MINLTRLTELLDAALEAQGELSGAAQYAHKFDRDILTPKREALRVARSALIAYVVNAAVLQQGEDK